MAGSNWAEAERAGSVDVLIPRVLTSEPVSSDPEALRGAGGATIDAPPEDDGVGDGTTRQKRLELGALRGNRGHLIELRGG